MHWRVNGACSRGMERFARQLKSERRRQTYYFELLAIASLLLEIIRRYLARGVRLAGIHDELQQMAHVEARFEPPEKYGALAPL